MPPAIKAFCHHSILVTLQQQNFTREKNLAKKTVEHFACTDLGSEMLTAEQAI